MKTFWQKILPLSLPFLALLLVLSSCGKGNKVTANILNHPKDTLKTAFGQRANGAASSQNLEAFAAKCSSQTDINGTLESHGTVCAKKVASVQVSNATAGKQPITDSVAVGDLVVVSGNARPEEANVYLNNHAFMALGPDRKLADDAGPLDFVVVTAGTFTGTATVVKCFGPSDKEPGYASVFCNLGILSGNR